MVAGRLANLEHGGDRVSEQVANLQLAPVTLDAASQLLGVSKRSVCHAKEVLTRGVPELVAAVDRGEIAVSPEVLRNPPSRLGLSR